MKARQQGTVISGTNGLYYLRARYYDPTIGRFLTRDPLPGSVRDPQSLNAYPYVQNNPVNRVDPTLRPFGAAASASGSAHRYVLPGKRSGFDSSAFAGVVGRRSFDELRMM